MGRRLFRAVWLAALLGTAGGLSGCAVYPAASVGVGYRSPGYYGGSGLLPALSPLLWRRRLGITAGLMATAALPRLLRPPLLVS